MVLIMIVSGKIEFYCLNLLNIKIEIWQGYLNPVFQLICAVINCLCSIINTVLEIFPEWFVIILLYIF